MENLNAENITNEIQSLIKALKDCDGWVKRGNGEGWFNHEILEDALSLIKELAQANEQLSESYDHLEKTKDELLAERARLTEENEMLKGRNKHLAECLDMEDKYKDRLQGILLQFTDIVHKWGNKNGYDTSEISLVPVMYEANTIKSQIVADTVREMQERLTKEFDRMHKNNFMTHEVRQWIIDQIAKEMLEGEK